ncbi:hypothetical protein KC19_VG339900 [Ceratodon purpureus]|uniref:Uncharacterized protein n=1 Tax=Ceratodon purpureus TaxID=3225 RepID=A0A8T0HW66_CERPU|nr:hypothetical protein KC19_VG339900 [Ceratodon purpureus]
MQTTLGAPFPVLQHEKESLLRSSSERRYSQEYGLQRTLQTALSIQRISLGSNQLYVKILFHD